MLAGLPDNGTFVNGRSARFVMSRTDKGAVPGTPKVVDARPTPRLNARAKRTATNVPLQSGRSNCHSSTQSFSESDGAFTNQGWFVPVQLQTTEHVARPTRVVLVDDHPLIREGLEKLFDEIGDIDLVDFAADGETAVDVCRRSAPDVALVDLKLPGIDGIETTRRLFGAQPSVRVLILTSFPSRRTAEEAAEAGAIGCLAKDDSADTILDAIRAAATSDEQLH